MNLANNPLLLDPSARIECQSLMLENGTVFCIEEAQTHMRTENPVLYTGVHMVLNQYKQVLEQQGKNPDTAETAFWLGATLTYLALRCNPMGLPVLGKGAVRYIQRDLEKTPNMVERIIVAASSDEQLRNMLAEEEKNLEDASPCIKGSMYFGAGCIYFYCNEQFQHVTAAQWN